MPVRRCAPTVLALTIGAAVVGCANDGPALGSGTPGESATGTEGPTGAGGVTDAGTAGASAGDDGTKFDTPSGGSAGDRCGGPDGSCGCSFVDLLFVIDNSASMGVYQEALGIAFAGFADALRRALPQGVNVHVGVTSTEMARSSRGLIAGGDGMCTFSGDDNAPNDAFYVPPDAHDTGRNGAQGRLYRPDGTGPPFFEFTTDGPPAQLDALNAWFTRAAQIGEGGSNIEMLTAPVAWVDDPANDGTNAGFLRDEGAALVLFFMQDEPDQTPDTIDGQRAGTWALDRLAVAKAGCGGLHCIIAGGLLDAHDCGLRPIDDFLDALADPPTLAPLPHNTQQRYGPAAAAEEINALLSDTLAAAIATKCQAIDPAG